MPLLSTWTPFTEEDPREREIDTDLPLDCRDVRLRRRGDAGDRLPGGVGDDLAGLRPLREEDRALRRNVNDGT